MAVPCAGAAESTGITVALSGVFQNRLALTQRDQAAPRRLQGPTHQQVPPNDGGGFLGQAAMGLFGN